MVADTLAVAGAIAGLFSNSKDAERLARNQFAYNLVQTSGNQAAADFLAGRAGLFGAVGHQVPAFGDKDTPGMVGTWATSKAATDAMQKYSALKSSGAVDPAGKVVAKVTGGAAGGASLVTVAGFGAGLPLWALVLLAAGLGLAVWKGMKTRAAA